MNKENNERKNGLEALKTVKKVLTDIGWEPKVTEIEEVLMVDFSKENLPIDTAYFDIRVDYERFICYFNFSKLTPLKYRKETMKFTTLANFDLVIGNFEINLDSGLVRFKSSVDFTNILLSETLIRNSIKSAMDNVEVYADSLVLVMLGQMKADEAIKAVESDV